MASRTEGAFFSPSASLNEGQPDKIYDLVSDAVVDACLTCDSKCKVACETCVKDGMVVAAGEITVAGQNPLRDCGAGRCEEHRI